MLLSYGPRRPDWSRSGPPSRLEWSALHAHRRWVLDGYPSASAASLHGAKLWLKRVWEAIDVIKVLVEAVARRSGIRLRQHVQAPTVKHAKPPALPRPPGIADDHPLVVSGRYR